MEVAQSGLRREQEALLSKKRGVIVLSIPLSVDSDIIRHRDG